MASAISCMLFLSMLALKCPPGAAQLRQANISLDSSLRPTTNPPAWFSPSGNFALGFYPEGRGFFVGIWLATSDGNATIIWTAERDGPSVSKDAVLKLTLNGLKLEDRSISQFTKDAYASSASMLDSGNFVIYGSNPDIIIWQTFDIPTDTIMPGQILSAETELISSISDTNHSSGKFRLKMQNDENLVMYPVETLDVGEDAYWASGTVGYRNLSLNFDNDGRLYLFSSNFTKNITTAYQSQPTLIYRATLDMDGRFRLYAHDLKSKTMEVLKVLPDSTDQCDVKGTCGLNSYCTSTAGPVVCSCLPGFDYVDANRTAIGCTRIFTSNGCYHKNLVRLLGFCDEGSNRLLVYEYMSNGSLADLIFKTERRPCWDERVRIALDVARGIHYLAPEWHKNAPISVKADVYSFGIVLLEIVCCRKSLDLEAEVDAIVLLDWVYKCFEAGELEKLISDEVDMTELNRLVKVGLWCTQSEPAFRPAMKNVVMMLEGNIDTSLPPAPNSSS